MKRLLLILIIILSSGIVVSAQDDDSTPSGNLSPNQRQRIRPQNVAELSLAAFVNLEDADEAVWSPGGSLFTVAAGNVVYVYPGQAFNDEPIELLHGTKVYDIAFNGNGQRMYTVELNRINVWSVPDLLPLDRYDLSTRAITVNTDGSSIGFVSEDDTRIYIFDTARKIAIPFSGTAFRASGITFSPDEDTLAVSDLAGNVSLWNVRTGAPEGTIDASENISQNYTTPEFDPRDALAYSDDERILAVANFGFSMIDTSSNGIAYSRQIERADNDLPERYFDVLFDTRTGLFVAVGGASTPSESANNVARIWDMRNGRELGVVEHAGARNVALSPDGTYLATVGGDMVRLWTPASGLPTPDTASRYSQKNVVAACDTFNVENPLVEITNSVSLVWSWYATTEDLVTDHINASRYDVFVDTQPLKTWTYLTQIIDDPVNDNNPTVYYYAPLGVIEGGQHSASYSTSWTHTISDGFAEYGEGTSNPVDNARCSFLIGWG